MSTEALRRFVWQPEDVQLESRALGEGAGHEFHGNQWTAGVISAVGKLSKSQKSELVDSFVKIRNQATKEFKAEFKAIGAKLWHDDDAHALGPKNAEFIKKGLDETPASTLTVFRIPLPLTVMDSYPHLRSKSGALMKAVGKIRDRYQEKTDALLKEYGLPVQGSRNAGDVAGHVFHGNQWTTTAVALFDASRQIDGAENNEAARLVHDRTVKGVHESADARRESLLTGRVLPVHMFPGRIDVWRAFQEAESEEDVSKIEGRLVKGLAAIMNDREEMTK